MKPFRFGIAICATESPEGFIRTVKLAEDLGFDSVWIPDFRLYTDVYVALSLAAQNTSRVRLGNAVTNPYTRHPGMTAVGIATVDLISGGRAVLGLGAGGVVLRLLEIERAHPVDACREAVSQIRGHLGHPDGAADVKPLELPSRPDLPIFIGATGPRMLALAGKVADGVIVNVGADQACVETALARVEEGVGRAKRPPEGLEKLCWLQGTVVSDDPAEAIRGAKPATAFTLGRLPDDILETMGMDVERIRQIHHTYHTVGMEAGAEMVSDEMVERFTITGTPDRAVGELKRLQQLGFDEYIFLVEEVGNVHAAITSLAETVIQPLKVKEMRS